MDLPYRPDIDGLRAIAVLAVVAFHAFPAALGGGYVGVDVFFVISGYLITGIIVRALEVGTFSFAGFYARRARRILPALVLVLAACYALGWFELLPNEFRQLSSQIVAAAAFFANFEFWRQTSYFDGVAVSKPLLHLWSLSIEEQFYLVWPVTLWLVSRWRRNASLLTTAIVGASFVWCLVEIHFNRAAAFYSPATRAWELLIGALLVQFGPRLRTHGWWIELQSWLGAALIATAAVTFDKWTLFPGYWALLPVSGAALLVAGGSAGAWVNRRILAHPVLVWIGLISYPLYLWHWPLFSFAYLAGIDDGDVGDRAALIAASFLLAFLTHRVVELPLRSGGFLNQKAFALGALLIVIGAGAWATERANGFAFRISDRIRPLAAYGYDYRDGTRVDRCWLTEPAAFDAFAPECLKQRPHAKQTLLLWGDSHAGAFYPGLREVLPRDVDILEVVRSSCLPILEFAHPTCIKTARLALETIRRTKPSTVLLFASWTGYSTRPQDTDFTQALENTVRQVRAADVKKIVLVGPAPRWNRSLPRLMVSWLIQHPDQATSPTHTTFGLVGQIFVADALLRALAERQGAIYVSLLHVMCDETGCLTTVPGGGGALTFWDDAHLTRQSAAWIATQMMVSGVVP
jgi:peptidoglycan/LPS O-acetylase OafA/YrhL